MSLEESISDFAQKYRGEHIISISYSGKFSPFNARVVKRGNQLSFKLSRDWEKVSDMIVLGLLESLAAKILKVKGYTSTSIDLYHSFIKSLHIGTPKTSNDDYLEAAFNRINEKFFTGMLDRPNFAWHNSSSKLATYDHHTDTLSVSELFRGHDELVDFLVYHELLHKKLKFRGKGLRTVHHGKEFRKLEEAYPGHEEIERKLTGVIRARRKLF